jgi:transposase
MLSLTLEQRMELEKGIEEGNRYLRLHCQAVLLNSEGHSSEDIARIMGVSEGRIVMWLENYRLEGFAGLKTKSNNKRQPPE